MAGPGHTPESPQPTPKIAAPSTVRADISEGCLPKISPAHGFFWMLYTGRDAAENRKLGLARSTDGVHFQKLPAVFGGTAAWDSKVVCDPEVAVVEGEVRVWFGGGDVARPDENLNGQIGYGILRPSGATVKK